MIDAAYEKRSIAISSNIHPSGFDELMPKTIATATVDRLMHHAHVLITDAAESYRLAQATAGKGSNRCPERDATPLRWGASWPPAGRKHGHQWGEKMAADGEKPMAIDTLHAGCGGNVGSDLRCDRCGKQATRGEIELPPGPGAPRGEHAKR